jgi:mono/diheme cytochrome c family protein
MNHDTVNKPSPEPSPAHLRERPDPDEEQRPLPWFLIMFLGAMAMWGGFYIYSTPDGGPSAHGDQRTLTALMPPPAPAEGSVDGGKIYQANCAACHQATGAGVAGVFPPLDGAEWVTGDPAVLSQILLHGVTGPITVKGNTYNGAMPGFGRLADAELAAVMTYIRGQWRNKAEPISASFVAEQRSKTADRVTPFNGEAELATLK